MLLHSISQRCFIRWSTFPFLPTSTGRCKLWLTTKCMCFWPAVMLWCQENSSDATRKYEEARPSHFIGMGDMGALKDVDPEYGLSPHYPGHAWGSPGMLLTRLIVFSTGSNFFYLSIFLTGSVLLTLILYDKWGEAGWWEMTSRE